MEFTHSLEDGEQVIEADCNIRTDYVDIADGTVKPRPVLDGIYVNGSVLTGVPAGATVWVSGYTSIADGSDIELDFPAGSYRIFVDLWPYLVVEVAYENDA